MPSTSAPNDTSARQVRRLQGFARALFIYGLLIGGSIVFSLPFIWMVGTSFKVDREMFSEQIRFMPMKPIPHAASPYLDARYFSAPEADVYPRVKEVIEETLRRSKLPLPDYVANIDQAVSILTPGLFKKLWETFPASAWEASDDDLFANVRQRITPELIAETARKVYRHLAFGSVRVRSTELQEQDLTAGTPLSAFWKIDAGIDAELIDLEETATPTANLLYNFADRDDGTITLSKTLPLPFQADHLARVQIALQPDDTWHRLEFQLEKNGILYEGLRPEFLGDFEPKVVTLQEYGPDDLPDASKIRLWIAYREIDRGPQYESGEDRVKVTMTLHRTSPLGAWQAKCARNYQKTLDYIPFWRFAATSAFLVILNILGNVFSCSLVAYAFARLQWPGRNFSFALMLATLMIPPQVTMIPYFLIIKYLGWYNTLKPLWVISFFGNAFNVFLLRQFMKGIPRDLEDAAKIDGCNFLHIYWYVIMPLIKPTLACIAIFTFMGVWNDFMGPLIYLSDQRLYPLSLGLYALNVTQGGQFGMLMAGSLLMTLPVIAIFFFAQKYFIQGITLTGVKG